VEAVLGNMAFDVIAHHNSRRVKQHRNIPVSDAHPLGVQILLVELKETKHRSEQTARLVEVFLFDYDGAGTHRKLVDVDSREIVTSTEISSAHLPLTDQEIAYGKALMWQDTELLQRLSVELNHSTDIADLQSRVSVWVPGRDDQSGLSHCDVERCALVSLFTEDNDSLPVEPVINLMRSQVYTDLVQ